MPFTKATPATPAPKLKPLAALKAKASPAAKETPNPASNKSPEVAARDAALRAMRLHPTTDKTTFLSSQEWCDKYFVMPSNNSSQNNGTHSTTISNGDGNAGQKQKPNVATQVAVTLLLLRLTRAYQKQQKQKQQADASSDKASDTAASDTAATSSDTDKKKNGDDDDVNNKDKTTKRKASEFNDKDTDDIDTMDMDTSVLMDIPAVLELVHVGTDLSAAVPAYFAALMLQQQHQQKQQQEQETLHPGSTSAAAATPASKKESLAKAAAAAAAAVKAGGPAVTVVATAKQAPVVALPAEQTHISVAVVAAALFEVLKMTQSASVSVTTNLFGNGGNNSGSNSNIGSAEEETETSNADKNEDNDNTEDKDTDKDTDKETTQDDTAMDTTDDNDVVKILTLTPAVALYKCMVHKDKNNTDKDKDDNASDDKGPPYQYVQFLQTTLTTLVQQCRQEVQGWQDFEFVWTTVFQDNNKSAVHKNANGIGGKVVGSDKEQPVADSKLQVSKYFQDAAMLQTALLLEPAIPGLPDTDATIYDDDDHKKKDTATTESSTKTATDGVNLNVNNCGSSDDPTSPQDRVQVVAWKISCLVFNASDGDDNNNKNNSHRRQRLLASCAALGLLAVLPLIRVSAKSSDSDKKLTEHITADPSLAVAETDDDKDNEEPATKRPRQDPDAAEKSEESSKDDMEVTASTTKEQHDVLQVLVEAANQEAAFTRWACLEEHKHKIAFDLNVDELATAIQALASKLVATLTEELKKENPALTRYPGADEKESAMVVDGDDEKDGDSSLSSFLQTLKKQVGDAKQLTWYLPSLVDSLNSTILRELRRTRQPVAAIPMLDLISLASLKGSMDQFCALTSKPPVKGQTDVAVAAVAGTRSSKAPAAAEKMVASTVKAAAKSTKANQGPQSPGQTLRRAVTPPIITEGMELNEWTVSILYLEVVKPSRNLKTYLEASSEEGEQKWHEVMLPVLNRTLLRLSQENMADKPTRIAAVSVGMEPEGQVNIFGEMTPDKQLCKAVVALYYHSLEAVLFCESARLDVQAHPRIVLNDVFHRALLACCCSVVVKAVGATQKVRTSVNLQTLQIYSILHITESNPYDCLKVSESFHRALTLETARGKLGSPLIFALPRILQREAKQTEVQILDSLLWARDPKFIDSMPDKIEEFEEKSDKAKESDAVCLWPPEILAPTLREEIEDLGGEKARTDFPTQEHPDFAEYKCVSYLLRKLLRFAFHRIQALCKVLDVPHDLPVATQVWVAFRYLLRHNIDLLYDRHVDHWILCSLYGVGKTLKLKPDISFARIIEAYVSVRGQELGDVTCQRIVRHIKISTGSNANATIGNVIVLYNKVFVPSMKEHLLKSRSLKRSILEVVEAQTLPSKAVASRSGTPSARSSDDGAASSTGPAKATVPRVGKSPESKTVVQASENVAKSETVVESTTEIGVAESTTEKGEASA
jgi:hypothetical protein